MTDPTAQLRDLMVRAVPDDAPALDPQALAGAARRSRTRARAVAAVAAVGVVAAGGLTTALVAAPGDDGGTVADRPTSAPYDAPLCPASLPELADAATGVAGLEGLSSVRYCPDLRPQEPAGWTATPEEEALLARSDALVTGLDDFATAVAAAPAFDPGACAAMSVMNDRTSVQLTYADGRSALLPLGTCLAVDVGGLQVDGSALRSSLLDALDEQRDRLTYAEPPSLSTDPSCTDPDLGAARPDREGIVAGVLCDTDRQPVQALDEDQVATLAAAWSRPGPVPAGADGTTCAEREQYLTLVATTDHGDVVRLRPDCGHLRWESWSPDEAAAVPTTLADLGISVP